MNKFDSDKFDSFDSFDKYDSFDFFQIEAKKNLKETNIQEK